MNVDKIKELAACIRSGRYLFNMRLWDHCVVGTAHRLWPERVKNMWDAEGVCNVLLVNPDKIDELVHGDGTQPLSTLTREVVANTLDRLAETGEVSWDAPRDQMGARLDGQPDPDA